jgi:hypothetical protein
MNSQEVINKIKEKVVELNDLFEKAADHDIKFDFQFNQDRSFGKGKVAHIVLNAYSELK